MKTQIHRASLAMLAGLALTVGSAHASLLAYDNFSTYAESPTSINGQYGAPGANMVGFAGSGAGKQWTSNTAVAVTGGVLNQGANLSRSRRAFASTPLVSSGTIYVRARLAISNAAAGVNFSALELAPTLNSDANTVRLTGADGGLSLNANGTGGVSSAVIGPSSNAMHVWLIELNLNTKAGKVWLDPNTGAFNPTVGSFTFTAPSAFALNGINLATYGTSSSVQLDDLWVGTTLGDVGVAVAEITPPAIASLNPPDGSAGVYPGSVLVATFDEPIALTGGGSITITDTDNGSASQTITVTDPLQVTVSGNNLIINPPANLAFNKPFEVGISSGTIQDAAASPNVFPGTTAGQWNFTTAAQEFTAPVITLKSPADDDSGVSASTNIVATFDQNILLGSGDIIIKDLQDNSSTKTIAVTDASQVSVSGNVLTINPTTNLLGLRSYAVQIASGAVKNYSDLPFAGISNETDWNFSTPAALLAFDDFSTYASGTLNGKNGGGSLMGFGATTWIANSLVGVNLSSNGKLSQGANLSRSRRSFSPSPLVPSGIIYLRTNISLSAAAPLANFSALEFGAADGNTNIRLAGSDLGLRVDVSGSGGLSSAVIAANDGLNHEWLLELNLATGIGKAWIGANIAAFNPSSGGAVFTAPTAFSLSGINVATSGASSEVFVDDIRIGDSWSTLGVTVVSGPSDTFVDWIGGYDVGGQTGVNQDPDGDDIDNGVENFFGTAPDEFSQGLIAGTYNAGVGTFTFTHPQGTLASDLSATYQWSKDLATFYPEGAGDGTTVAFSSSTAAGITTVTATITGTIPNKFFVRVNVTQN